MDDRARKQLDIIRQIGAVLGRLRVRFWLRGGWAGDFMLGEITRPHADIDLVLRARHRRHVSQALTQAGFLLDREIDTQSEFWKDGQDVSIIYLTRAPDGRVVTQGIPGWAWPTGALPLSPSALEGIMARVVSPEELFWEKESYERGTGRPLRSKDLASMMILPGMRSSHARCRAIRTR